MEFHLAFSTLTLILVLLLVHFVIKHFKRNKLPFHKNLPPGPRKLPIVGNMLHLTGTLPHHALRDLAKKHGPLMHLQLGEISTIVISSNRVAEQVLRTHDIAFANRPGLQATKVLTYNHTDIAFSPYSEYWRQMRKICTLELLTAKRVRSFSSSREDEIWDVTESIRLQSCNVEQSLALPINLSEMIFSSTNNMVCRSTFGKRFNRQDVLIPLMKKAIQVSSGFDVADVFPSWKLLHRLSRLSTKLQKLHCQIDMMFESIINEYKETKSRDFEEDMLGVLLRLQEGNSLEYQFTSDNVKAVLQVY